MSIETLIILIMCLPVFGGLFVLNAKDSYGYTFKNAGHVALLTLTANTCLLLTLFSKISSALEKKYAFSYLLWDRVILSFGADVLTLVFVLGVQIALLLGVLGIKKEHRSQKGILFYSLFYLSLMNGYFFAQDILSFYICFAGQLFPLYMLLGFAFSESENKKLAYLLVHYFLGAVLLLAAFVLMMHTKKGDVLIEHLSMVHLSYKKSLFIWGGIFFALMLRMPIWPFHNALTTVLAKTSNPLAFIALNILPMSGIYAFMRYWPQDIPIEIQLLSPIFQFLCVLTMFFASIGGYLSSVKEQKLHHYIFVYTLLYLFAVFLPTDVIRLNIAYCVFSFLLMSSCLIVLQAHIHRESEKNNLEIKGVLCYMPRTSLCYSLFTLAAIGLPVSALFWNNFMIVSEIFNYHLYAGTAVVLTMALVSSCLLANLYDLKSQDCSLSPPLKIKDIDVLSFIVCLCIMLVLLLSFVHPLWFVV